MLEVVWTTYENVKVLEWNNLSKGAERERGLLSPRRKGTQNHKKGERSLSTASPQGFHCYPAW
jgi:hypothetical protein